jgi:hypothetical protein
MDVATRAAGATDSKSVVMPSKRRGGKSLPHLEERGKPLATTALATDFIQIVADEMSAGVERAVEYWLTQIDQIVTNDKITALGKLTAVQGVLRNYERLTGKGHLQFACDK